jgi:hypothetical protein
MPDLTLPAAKEVVAQAIKYDAWAWDDPDSVTDELVASTAQTLVDAAAQASQNGSVADAVMEILFAAKVEPLSEPSKQAYTQRFGQEASTNGTAVASDPPAPGDGHGSQPDSSDATSTESEASASAIDIESIFPGYDDLKAADIKKAILASALSGDLKPEEVEQIKAYEAANEERKSILSLEPEFKAPDPDPEPQADPSVPSGFVSNEATNDDVAAFYAGEQPSRAQQENLPLPAPVDTSQNPPVLPIDITNVSPQELSRVATQFHSCFARTQWLQSQEEGRERAAEHLEREAERDAYVAAYEMHKGAIPEEKRSQPTALEAARKAAEKDAEMAETVRKYRSAKVRHAADARELRALAAGYDKAVWRINEELDRRARESTNKPS